MKSITNVVVISWLLLSSYYSFSSSQGNIVRESDKDEDTGRRDAKKFNFASEGAGAIILDKSPDSAKGYGNLLNDDKDKYGISPCHEKKWVVIGLSEDITVTGVEMSNFEKYSSMLKDFQLLASTTYPTEEWIDLGTYTAQPTLGSQLFNVTNTASYTRYLKFKFLTHYLDEALCTLSQIKVFGMTVIASFHQEVQQSDDHMRDMLSHLHSSHHEDVLLDADAFEEMAYDEGYGLDDGLTLGELQREKVPVTADNVQLSEQRIDQNVDSATDLIGVVGDDTAFEKHSVDEVTIVEVSAATTVTNLDNIQVSKETASVEAELPVSLDESDGSRTTFEEDSNDDLATEDVDNINHGEANASATNGIYSSVFGEYASVLEGYFGQIGGKGSSEDVKHDGGDQNNGTSSIPTDHVESNGTIDMRHNHTYVHKATELNSASNKSSDNVTEINSGSTEGETLHVPVEINTTESKDEISQIASTASIEIESQPSINETGNLKTLINDTSFDESNTMKPVAGEIEATSASMEGTYEPSGSLSSSNLMSSRSSGVHLGHRKAAVTSSCKSFSSSCLISQPFAQCDTAPDFSHKLCQQLQDENEYDDCKVESANGVTKLVPEENDAGITLSGPSDSSSSAFSAVKRIIESKLAGLGIPILSDTYSSADDKRSPTELSSSSSDVLSPNISDVNSTNDEAESASFQSATIPSVTGNMNDTPSNASTHSDRNITATETTVAIPASVNRSDQSIIIEKVSDSSSSFSVDRDALLQRDASSKEGIFNFSSYSGIPSNCFETLSFAEFQKKMKLKLQSMIGGNFSQNGDPPSTETTQPASSLASADNNVFRALMQKIKTLEMSNVIVEKYIVQMSECYRAVTRELLYRTKKMNSENDVAYDPSLDTIEFVPSLPSPVANKYRQRENTTATNERSSNLVSVGPASEDEQASILEQFQRSFHAWQRVSHSFTNSKASNNVSISAQDMTAVLYGIMFLLWILCTMTILLFIALCCCCCCYTFSGD